MNVGDSFQKAPPMRPMLNLGCLMDIPTGKYKKGKHGEHILNGGLSHITGIGGRGNMHKSTFTHFMFLCAAERYLQSQGILYDTEVSLTYDRLDSLATGFALLSSTPLEDNSRFVLTNKTVIIGNEWFEQYRNLLKERKNDSKNQQLTTPFIDRNGEPVKTLNPLLGEVDSFSQMDVQVVEAMYDKNQIGDSKLNTEALRGAAAKSQLMAQLPGVTAGGGGYLLMTAHVGDEHQLDQYAPSTKKLSFMNNGIKFKRVPENFTFLTNNLWVVLAAKTLINQAKKTPEFPRNKEDDLVGDTDLMVITIKNLRPKSGPAGMPFDLIVSQSDGVHVGLSEFWYCKSFGSPGYGIGGHDRSYYLELYPEVALQRTTVRGKIDDDRRLRRALEITSELCQMRNIWHDIEPGLLLEPKILYERIKSLGYDWNTLLDTRGYWMFEEDVTAETLPFLSTMDLLKMAAEQYVPYWMEGTAKYKDHDTQEILAYNHTSASFVIYDGVDAFCKDSQLDKEAVLKVLKEDALVKKGDWTFLVNTTENRKRIKQFVKETKT